MLRYITVTLVFLFATVGPVWGQLKITSNGNIEMKESTEIQSSLNVFHSLNVGSSAEFGARMGIGTSTSISAQVDVIHDSDWGHDRRGLRSQAIGQNYFNYGIEAHAENGQYHNRGFMASASGSGSYAGYFTGDIYVGGSINEASDMRFKQNIQTLERGEMLDRIIALQPRRYEHRTEQDLRRDQALPDLNMSEGEQLGMLAQELEEVFPELVSDVIHMLDEEELAEGQEPVTTTTKAVDYNGLIVALIAAMQEQQAQIEELQQHVD